jgi:hypothetical protein
MFKYYVVGNLNIKDIEDPASADNDTISFRLRSTKNVLEPNGSPKQFMDDHYNFPSVCIHLAGSQTNLCKRYSVPGLPEFGSSNLPGAEEASRGFINSLIATKVLDCIDQTRLNMLVNLTWAYNVNTIDDETIIDQGPQIMADKQGAWPKAIEVAMRIRNLERAVNRPAQTAGVCAEGATNKTGCSTAISTIMQEKKLGNERIVKAFFSGYRNLGNEIESEMKQSFTLTEIPPKEADLRPSSASYLLVPESQATSYKKQYLDLQLMMVNLATFYNAFIPRSTKKGSGPPISGACDVSKVAMPVPGYPLGYYKNPDILTYYAVRGESEFIGMFNPFGSEPVKLTSYAAAKPFGGRIGPMLFHQPQGFDFFQGRTGGFKRRSVPYIASLDFVGTKDFHSQQPIGLGDFAPGIPLPINFQGDYFWLQNADSPLGGYVAGGDVQFGLPNLVYDYQVPFQDTGYTDQSATINVLKTADDPSADKAIGLFSKFQMTKFKGTALGDQVSQQLLEQEIKRIKAPTLYETANYMVPSPEELNRVMELDSVGFIPGQKTDVNGLQNYNASIFAPLFSGDQEDVFWKTESEVVTTVFEFLRKQEPGIMKYKRNMIKAAMTIKGQAANLDSGDGQSTNFNDAIKGFTDAALGVADIDFNQGLDQNIKSCKSIAGVFLYFYWGDPALKPDIVEDKGGCPQNLGENLRKYFSANNTSGGYSPSHYEMNYTFDPGIQKGAQSLFTAYMPGPYTGIGMDGVMNNPITQASDETMRRNFYSTKFVGLSTLQVSGPWDEKTSNFSTVSEGPVNSTGANTSQNEWRNPLDAQAIGADLNAIRY